MTDESSRTDNESWITNPKTQLRWIANPPQLEKNSIKHVNNTGLMNTIMNQERIEQLFKELKKFSADIIEFNSPIKMNIIDKFEKEFNLKLPEEYKLLLQLTNGFNLMGDMVLGITFKERDYDLVYTYVFEHYNTNNPMPKHLIPFSPDGGGNFYCFDTLKKTNNGLSYSIVFWASDYEYTENDQPEVTHSDLVGFINECIIGWTLEDYNYDGSEKYD